MLNRTVPGGTFRSASLLVAAAGALLLAGGLAALIASAAAPAISQTLAKDDPVAMVAPILAPVVPAPASLFGKSRIHILVLGRDYDYDSHDMEYSKASRSDIIMAFTVDFKAHRITELSVPRDTAVTMPDGSRQKINAALSAGGIPEARAVVSNFLGVSFDRYALLRIDSTKDLIDAIGGVDVPVTTAVNYDDSWGHLHVHVTPGVHHFNGDQAVSYARFRHDECGDPCRIKRQQDVLHAIAGKLRNDRLGDVLHARALVAVIQRSVETDISERELLSLGWSFHDIDPKKIAFAQVPYTDDVTLSDGGDALVPNDAAKKQLVDTLMLGKVR